MDSKHSLISIIIPVFQVEVYIERCIKSIINQTYKNIEIILVDDGSTDKSGDICDKYSLIDNRIKVHHIKNGGVSKARQFGIKQSTGEYIVFVDSDDYIPNNSISLMNEYRTKNNLDIVIGAFNICNDSSNKYIPIKNEIINQEEYIKRLLLHKSNPGPCGKLYKKKLFSDNSFPPLIKGEDYLMNLDIALNIKSVGYINSPVYFYYQRDNSVIHLHKTNLAYEKEYNILARNIIKKTAKFNSYEREFLTFTINQLYTIFINKADFNRKDSWIKEIITTSKKYKLTFKESITIKAIYCKLLQNIIANCRILYFYLFKI